MKRFITTFLSAFVALTLSAQIPFSFVKTKPQYDPDAKAYFDANTANDYQDHVKAAWSNRVAAMKANGTWSSSVGGFPFLPTSSVSEPLRNAKTLIVNANYIGTNSSDTVSPYITCQTYVGSEGLMFNANLSTVGVGKFRTAIVPSSTMTLNNSAIAVGTTRDEAALAAYTYGAFQSATQSIIFQKRNAANACTADMYGSTVGTGRASQASGADGAKGCYIASRVSSTDFKLYKNGTSIATASSTQGTLPSIELYLGAFNGTTVSRNQPISYFWVYGSGLTPTQVAQETTDWNIFAAAMGRYNTIGYNIVVDGNSHTVYNRASFARSMSYYNDNFFVAKYHHIGISGQTTTNCLANASANVTPLYDGTISKNIYLCWEATNDISTGIHIDSVKARYLRLCQGRRTTGFKVLAMPAMCRDFSGDTTKIMNTYYFNEWLAANWTTFADAVVDPNDALLSNHYYIKRSDYANTTAYKTAVMALTDDTLYFSDGQTHLTDFGYLQWGIVVAIKIRDM